MRRCRRARDIVKDAEQIASASAPRAMTSREKHGAAAVARRQDWGTRARHINDVDEQWYLSPLSGAQSRPQRSGRGYELRRTVGSRGKDTIGKAICRRVGEEGCEARIGDSRAQEHLGEDALCIANKIGACSRIWRLGVSNKCLL